MTNKKLEESLTSAWSASVPDARSTRPELTKTTMAKLIDVKAKMLLTSRLYLKVDQTKMGSRFNQPIRTDPSNATLTAQ